MILRSPVAALLWENWQLTRAEVAQRLGIGIVGGAAALLLLSNGATVAFWLIFTANALFYMSIARLNGGRFMDGYKPGFPLYLLYSRPVATAAFVGVAMTYDAISSAVLYVVTAALLMLVFGQPFPLLPVAAVMVATHLVYTCIQWSTRSRVFQWIGTLVAALPAFFLIRNRASPPFAMEFSLAEYALMFLIGVVSIGLTVIGVARQRRGDAFVAGPRAAASGEYPDWIVNMFRFACPTSSATSAQVWFELKTSGFPMLAMGLGAALLIYLLFAASIPIEILRPFAIFSVMIFAPALLLLVSGNAFGIRRRQGRTYASAFELTQPYGTAGLVGLKLLVRTACVLVALAVAGASVWAASSLMGAWESWVVAGSTDAVPGLLGKRQAIADAFAGQTGYFLAVQAVIWSVCVALMVAFLAAISALRARYPRPMLIAGSLLLGHCLALVLVGFAKVNGIVSPLVAEIAFKATGATILLAMVLAIVYLFWSGFTQRALTIRYATVAVLISAAFAAAWLTLLQAIGVQLSGTAVASALAVLWPVLLPPLASLLAPWSLSRLRHQ